MIVSRTSFEQGSGVLIGLGPVNPLHDVIRSIPINKPITNAIFVFIFPLMTETIGPFSLLSFLNILPRSRIVPPFIIIAHHGANVNFLRANLGPGFRISFPTAVKKVVYIRKLPGIFPWRVRNVFWTLEREQACNCVRSINSNLRSNYLVLIPLPRP